MPLSLGIVSFLSHFDGLGDARQHEYNLWLTDRKEDVRRRLLITQLEKTRDEAAAEASAANKASSSAADDAEDKKVEVTAAKSEETAARAELDAISSAASHEDRQEKTERVERTRRLTEEAKKASAAADIFIDDAAHLLHAANGVAIKAAETLAEAQSLLEHMGTYRVVDEMELVMNGRLEHFKEWDVGDPLYYRTDRPYCAFNKAGPVEFPPDPAIGARLPGSQCVDPEPAAGTAVDVVRMLRGAHSDSDLKLAIRKIREIRAAEGGQR